MNTATCSLTRKIQDLSPSQVSEVEDFVDFLRSRTRDRDLTQTAAMVNTPVFAAIWSNPEDDVYDAL